MGSIDERSQRKEISRYCPFRKNISWYEFTSREHQVQIQILRRIRNFPKNASRISGPSELLEGKIRDR
jgi:hypothetical protein